MNWELIGKIGGGEAWKFDLKMSTYYAMEERVILRAPSDPGKMYQAVIDGEYYASNTSSTRQMELKFGSEEWQYISAPSNTSQYSQAGVLGPGEEVLLRRTSNYGYTLRFDGSISLFEFPDQNDSQRVWGAEHVEEVSLKDIWGYNTIHPLVDWEPPAGEIWAVSVEGSFSPGSSTGYMSGSEYPRVIVGGVDERATSTTDFMFVNGNILPGGSPPAIMTNDTSSRQVSFDGVVRVRKAKI